MAPPIKYKKEIHCDLLKALFTQGHGIATFCAEAGISRPTWYEWLKKYPEFKETADISHEIAFSFWEKQAIQNLNDIHFNQSVWGRIMMNRFDWPVHRKVKVEGLLEAKTHRERFNLIMNEIEHGRITPDEAIKLGTFLNTGAKIEEIDELKDRMAALEKMLCH